jgi:ketosteroid isomerase-like protein
VLAAVQALKDTFDLGLLVGDADLCASVYAPNGCLVPPDRRAVFGQRDIRDFWQQVFDEGRRGHALTSTGLGVGREQIFERGTYAHFTHPVASDKAIARGSYLIVAECQPDGSWAWVADVWSEAPARPTSAPRVR